VCFLPALCGFPALAETGLAPPEDEAGAPRAADPVDAVDAAALGWVRRGVGASGSAFRSSAITAWAVTHTGVWSEVREYRT